MNFSKHLSKSVNFCVAILILKLEENIQHLWHICIIIIRKIKTQLKHTKKVCTLYGEGAVIDQTRRKWFVKFHAGDFLRDDAPRLGRPVEVSG